MMSESMSTHPTSERGRSAPSEQGQPLIRAPPVPPSVSIHSALFTFSWSPVQQRIAGYDAPKSVEEMPKFDFFFANGKSVKARDWKALLPIALVMILAVLTHRSFD
jgi:hypothetical protein